MRFLAALPFLIFAISANAAPVTLESGVSQTPLLELYTSEGCSSCPPAEAWLSTLENNRGLWREFVPVAFHVDYWNGLGWPDRFSASKFSQRQRQQAAQHDSSTVYTPGFVLAGEEWRRNDSDLHANSREKVGVLKAEVSDGGNVRVTFAPTRESKGDYVVKIAPLASGVATNVRAGENRGRNLEHSFVALALLDQTMIPQTDGSFEASATLPKKSDEAITSLAIWVEKTGVPTPIQAVGGSFKLSPGA